MFKIIRETNTNFSESNILCDNYNNMNYNEKNIIGNYKLNQLYIFSYNKLC